MRNPPVNLNDSYWGGIRKAVAAPRTGPRPGKKAEGIPIPGGGCYTKIPNRAMGVLRLDVECSGAPTLASLLGAKDPHGQKVRGLLRK